MLLHMNYWKLSNKSITNLYYCKIQQKRFDSKKKRYCLCFNGQWFCVKKQIYKDCRKNSVLYLLCNGNRIIGLLPNKALCFNHREYSLQEMFLFCCKVRFKHIKKSLIGFIDDNVNHYKKMINDLKKY